MTSLQDTAESFRDRSASCWPQKISTPILIQHGSADERVQVDQARQIAAQLTESLRSKIRYVEFMNDDHQLKNNWNIQEDNIVEWFTQHIDRN